MDTAIGNSVPVSRILQGQFTGQFDNQSERIELAKSIGQGAIRGTGPGVAQRLTRRIARRVARQMSRKAVAWLASRRLWSPRVIAAAPGFQSRLTSELEGVRREMKARTGCDIAIGAARSRSVARTASRVAGSTAAPGTSSVMVVAPGQERAFLAPLPLRRLDGVSEPTLRVLRASGLVTIGELQKVPKAALQAEFGPEEGLQLWRTARGIDTQPANGARPALWPASWQERLFSGWARSGTSLLHRARLLAGTSR